MKKIILTTVTTFLTVTTFAKGGSDIGTGNLNTMACEAVHASYLQNSDSKYKMTSERFSIPIDSNGEGEAELKSHSAAVFLAEDENLKGLYQLGYTTGKNPMFDTDGSDIGILLKKDDLLSKSDTDSYIPEGLLNSATKTARVYTVVYGVNLSGVSVVAMTNKLFKLLRAHSLSVGQAPNAKTMMIHDAISVLEQPEIQNIIAKNFTDKELLFSGLNTVCISNK